jgi:hypothetical protein
VQAVHAVACELHDLYLLGTPFLSLDDTRIVEGIKYQAYAVLAALLLVSLKLLFGLDGRRTTVLGAAAELQAPPQGWPPWCQRVMKQLPGGSTLQLSQAQVRVPPCACCVTWAMLLLLAALHMLVASCHVRCAAHTMFAAHSYTAHNITATCLWLLRTDRDRWTTQPC